MTPRDELAVKLDLARRDFYFFTRLMFLARRGYRWVSAYHHALICAALFRVFMGQTKNLIINIPPRYSKTEIAVVNFAAWALGQVPDAEFIHTSYSGTLASDNSWQIRELIEHEMYQRIFPGTRLSRDSKARDHWKTTAGGVMYAAGEGGTITGFGAGKLRSGFGGAILIDDPHKADEARSDPIRKGVIEWFKNTLESRRNSKDTPIILIMQRLHEEDLAGWLLAGGNGETWEHLNLPALREIDGKQVALWPEKHSVADLLRMREAKPYTFAGQYQQRPAPPQGNIFKPHRLEVVDAVPAGTVFFRAWDFAASDNEGDWTVGLLLGITPSGRYIAADIVRFQGGPEMVQETLLNTAKADGHEVRISIPQDPGQAGKSQAANFVKMLSGWTVSATPESGDKVTRADPVASQVNVGNVMILRRCLSTVFTDELRDFPNGKHDDQVDALSRAFNAFISNEFGLLDYYAETGDNRADNELHQSNGEDGTWLTGATWDAP